MTLEDSNLNENQSQKQRWCMTSFLQGGVIKQKDGRRSGDAGSVGRENRNWISRPTAPALQSSVLGGGGHTAAWT